MRAGPHWTLLGLQPTADEREIKRAYARLLKQTRPEDDPEGFQRLREALERALAEAPRWAQSPPEQEGASMLEPDAPQEGPDQSAAMSGDEFVEAGAIASAANPWEAIRQELIADNRAGNARAALSCLEAGLSQAYSEVDEFLIWLQQYCAYDTYVTPPFLQACVERFGWLQATDGVVPAETTRALAQRYNQANAQQCFTTVVAALQDGDEGRAVEALAQSLKGERMESIDAREDFECRLMRYMAYDKAWHGNFAEAAFARCRWDRDFQHLAAADQQAWQTLLQRQEGERWFDNLAAMAGRRHPATHVQLMAAQALLLPSSSWRLHWLAMNSLIQNACRQAVALIDYRFPFLAERFDVATLAWWREPRLHLGRSPEFLGGGAAGLGLIVGVLSVPNDASKAVVAIAAAAGVVLMLTLLVGLAYGLQLWQLRAQPQLDAWDKQLYRRLHTHLGHWLSPHFAPIKSTVRSGLVAPYIAFLLTRFGVVTGLSPWAAIAIGFVVMEVYLLLHRWRRAPRFAGWWWWPAGMAFWALMVG